MYGTIDKAQLFVAKNLTIEPGSKCVLLDPGAERLFGLRYFDPDVHPNLPVNDAWLKN